MTAQVVTGLVPATLGVLTTLLTVFYGPAWKARLDRRHEQEDRSERLLARYSEPLARAAFDLQSRLYSILCLDFVGPEYLPQSYGVRSTLWLFGQYLAWGEILRREVQVLDLGEARRTARLQLHLLDIADVLASSTNIRDDVFIIRRAEQRAIGELMVVDRNVSGEKRSDCMGYAEFVKRLGDDDFAVWFQDLSRSMQILTSGTMGHTRLVHLQRALIDLVAFLDPDRVRFPDPNERGKVPLPSNVPPFETRKRARPPGELARFRYVAGNPWSVFEAWVKEHGLATVEQRADCCLVCLSREISFFAVIDRIRRLPEAATIRRLPWPLCQWLVQMNTTDEWVEISLAVGGHGALTAPTPPLLHGQRIIINDLLARFDRPSIAAGRARASRLPDRL